VICDFQWSLSESQKSVKCYITSFTTVTCDWMFRANVVVKVAQVNLGIVAYLARKVIWENLGWTELMYVVFC